MKNYEVEPLNYSDITRCIEALTLYVGTHKGQIGTYTVELLLKLERNKRILFDTPENDGEGQG